jgi:membrane protease YdiL (CAAX protease family)
VTIPLGRAADALHFGAARLLWTASILLVAIPLWYLTFGRRDSTTRLPFRWGDWSVAARDMSRKQTPQPYSRSLVGGYLLVVVIVFVLVQAGTGFRPLRSGALITLWPAICLSAIANAVAEEAVFRGVLQPMFLRVGGVAAGLWAQGALFGLVHWGASVGVLAALPTSLAIGLGSVMWGKATLETGGLGWVIVAHAMMDVAVMSAYFV